jgi:2-phosphosulfolactate phosphatase
VRLIFEEGVSGAKKARGLVVVVDVFRACTTACHILAEGPSQHLLVRDSTAAARLAARLAGPILVGRAEPHAGIAYDAPNSPTRAAALGLAGRLVVHRSDAAGSGVLEAAVAAEVVLGSFANASATASYIVGQRPEVVTLVAMGALGLHPTQEDSLCAEYLAALLTGKTLSVGRDLAALRSTSGSCFFTGAEEYPEADFNACTTVDSFAFAVTAEQRLDHASLRRVDR